LLTLIGWSLVGGSVAYSAIPLFEEIFMRKRVAKKKLVKNLYQAFANADLYKKIDKKEIYPGLLKVDNKPERLTFVFTVPKGLDPETFIKQSFVFKQHFGKYIDLDVDVSKAVLKVYPKGLPSKFIYRYDNVIESTQDLNLPITCGQNLEGNIHAFDLVKHPHILISGETGSGKSSEIRSILTTLIRLKQPDELKFILGDLKRSEFHIFKQIRHVEGVCHSADELRPYLKKVKKEMSKRGNKLDAAGVNSVDKLKEKLPYIVVCIDEVVLLKKETDIMDILEEISSIGRSLGVFIILSMQRPDAKLLDGKLKVNLTVRMGFMTADSTNSKIIGTPGSEKLNNPGRMLLKINSSLQEIQCPWLHNDKAKKLLQPYKKENKTVENEPQQEDEYAELRGLFHE